MPTPRIERLPPEPPTRGRHRIVIKLPQDLFNEMQAWCHLHGMTLTAFVRQATVEKSP